MSVYTSPRVWGESSSRVGLHLHLHLHLHQVSLQLPLRGVASKEVAITQTTTYLRVTFPPFYYELILHARVRPEVGRHTPNLAFQIPVSLWFHILLSYKAHRTHHTSLICLGAVCFRSYRGIYRAGQGRGGGVGEAGGAAHQGAGEGGQGGGGGPGQGEAEGGEGGAEHGQA